MAALTEAFLDTSVLVSGMVDLGEGSRGSMALLDAVAEERLSAATAWHCCLELYAVLTRLPQEYRVAPDDASELVRGEILARFGVHGLPAAERGAFVAALSTGRIAGGRTFDAHIAAVARASGAHLVVSQNRRHFLGLGLEVWTAEEAAARL